MVTRMVRGLARSLVVTAAMLAIPGLAVASAAAAGRIPGAAGPAAASQAGAAQGAVRLATAVTRRPHAVHPPAASPAGAAAAGGAEHGPAGAAAGRGRIWLTAKRTADTATAPLAPGSVCQVPGIGDIGGLIGLCNLGSSGLIGDLNNICQPSLPQPEPADGGIDALIGPPTGRAPSHTLYDSYGVAGQFWQAYDLQCSDLTSLIGNNVAALVHDVAKPIDRVTITVYQSAAGNGILDWLRGVADRLVTALGNAIYFPYLAPIVILGALWLAWQGLVRKRATRTIEGTLWMVAACAAAVWLIGKPADFTGVGTTVSNGVTQVLNVAFANLPNPGGSNCVPVRTGDPQSAGPSYSFTSSTGLVDENANELWSVLVCKPWLAGEFGTTQYATTARQPQTVVNAYGRQLLWAQAIAANERPTAALIKAKQATYSGIANELQRNYPAVYPLFQGKQWTTRLEIGLAALFAALVAGLLILLISLTLIILKLGFLLLLIAGPFFLIIGTHPGFGRIIAVRWFEMLVGVLMKQVAIALALSILLYAYSLIMGTSDAVLPWALKILMIALVTVAVFIYRKPFRHLFSSVGYGMIGSQERADISLRQAGSTFRRATLDTATATVPGVAAYRIGRWARRNPAQAAALATGIAGAAGAARAGTAAGRIAAAQATRTAGSVRDEDAAGPGAPGGATASQAAPDGREASGAPPGGQQQAPGGSRTDVAERTRRWPSAGDGGARRPAPPLRLPPRPAQRGRPGGQEEHGGPDGPLRPAQSRSGSGTGGHPPAWARGGGQGGGPAAPLSGGQMTGRRPAPPVPSSQAARRPSPQPAGGGRGAAGAWWQPGPVRSSGGEAGRTRPPGEPGAGRGVPPRDSGHGGPGENRSAEDGPPMPFWLRPVRRRK
jgi:hypothetical protein